MTSSVVAIEPTATYLPSEAARVVGISITTVNAAIVTGDLKAKLKPPGFKVRSILGADLLAWIGTWPDA